MMSTIEVGSRHFPSEYQDKVPVLLVNSSIDPIESNDNMVRKAQQLGLKVPYLADKDQTIMQRLGATKTPQAFLLKNNGGKFSRRLQRCD